MLDIVTPPIYSAHRELFERAYQRGYEHDMRLFSIGAVIEGVSQQVHAHFYPDDPAYAVGLYREQHKDTLDSYIAEQVTRLQASDGGTNALRRRAELYGKLSDQMVLLPVLFPQKDTQAASDLRRHFLATEGIYGSIAEVLEASLDDFFHGTNNVASEARHSLGHITELTTLGIVNRDQSTGFFALPTLPADDLLEKIDTRVFFRTKQAKHETLQIKTTERRIRFGKHQHRVIGGIALGNDAGSAFWENQEAPLQTSLAIVRENEGTISDHDEAVLDRISASVKDAIRNRPAQTETPRLAAAN